VERPPGARELTTSLAKLPPFDDDGHLNAIVDTAKGSRNKYEWDRELGLFRLGGVLPVGASFPFDFGFVPATRGEDGDELDVLVLMDEPAFVGCLVAARLVGVIEAEQTERDGAVEKNDRLIAVAHKSHAHRDVRTLDDLPAVLVDEIEHFFVSYNMARGKVFTPTGRAGPVRARHLVEAGTKGRKKARSAKKGRGSRS
jgi:inorganic pyrophosphatase